MIEEITDTLQNFYMSRQENVHTCLPGRISSFDPDTRKASVKPLIKLKNKNGSTLEIPLISDVPVVFPGGENFQLSWPVKSGDNCVMLFAETGIGNYLNGSGQVVDADDMSRFSLTDAICIPGLSTFRNVPERNVVIESTVNEKLIIENKLENMNTLLQDLITAINGIITTNGGAVNPASQANLNLVATRIATLLE